MLARAVFSCPNVGVRGRSVRARAGFYQEGEVKIWGIKEGWIRLSRLPGQECNARKGLIAWEREINIRKKNGTKGMRRWRCRKLWCKSETVKFEVKE